jgi:hypothetical protein
MTNEIIDAQLEEMDFDLSNLIVKDSELPIKEFHPIAGNSLTTFKIKMMSAIDKDRYDQWKESRLMTTIAGTGGTETVHKIFGDLLKRYLVGWENFTLRDMMNFVPMRLDKIGGENSPQLEQPIKFTEKNAKTIFQYDRNLCTWILGIASNREQFQSEEDIDRIKK